MQKYEILDYSLIKISGKDASQFLQSIVTSDIRERTSYSLLLSPQGRFLFDFFVTNMGDFYLIEAKSSQSEALIKKLMIYRLRSDVHIEILNEYCVLYSKTPLEISKYYEYKDPRFQMLGFRTIVERFSAPQSSDKIYEEDKYEFAIPEGDYELIQDKSMPQEYGIDVLGGISYTKGCYIGQEVISRTKYQGTVRKAIFKITTESDLSHIERGSNITQNDQQIGTFCSGYKNLGIALIRLNSAEINSIASISDITIKLEIPKWKR